LVKLFSRDFRTQNHLKYHTQFLPHKFISLNFNRQCFSLTFFNLITTIEEFNELLLFCNKSVCLNSLLNKQVCIHSIENKNFVIQFSLRNIPSLLFHIVQIKWVWDLFIHWMHCVSKVVPKSSGYDYGISINRKLL
jgi:hypothetical protein